MGSHISIAEPLPPTLVRRVETMYVSAEVCVTIALDSLTMDAIGALSGQPLKAIEAMFSSLRPKT